MNTAGEYKAGERAQAARPAGCSCHAAPGPPCGLSGDHLARCLLAKQPVLRTRESLKDVIAPHVIFQLPGERAAHTAETQTADQAIRAQTDTCISPGRIEASVESVPASRSGHPAPAFQSFSRGSDEVAATCTCEAGEPESGP